MAGNPFDSCSDQYSRFRPDYPPALIDVIHAESGNGIVIDCGAGTGKASAPFAQKGACVFSIEPSLAMIAQGLQAYPFLHYVCASAEALPIASHSAAAAIAAQAFHWFDGPRVLAEFGRVLKPDGIVALFWNTRSYDRPAARLFDELVQKWNPGRDPGYRRKDWGRRIEESGYFEPVRHLSFRQEVMMTPEDWIGLSRSISYVQSMGAEKVPGFESELRAGLATMPSTDCLYLTELWLAHRSGSVSCR